MQQQAAIESWWSSMTPAARLGVLDIEPGDFLPQHLAFSLTAHGVALPAVSVCWDTAEIQPAITAYVQPRALTEFIAAARIWHDGWAEHSVAG